MKLGSRRHWIFDLDGTLTQANHDFSAIKAELGLPPDRGILESLKAMEVEGPTGEIRNRLEAIELEVAARAQPADGVPALLERLRSAGSQIAVLTRNTRRVALATLNVTGLSDYFRPQFVLGREEAEPKPHPAGVEKLLRAWRTQGDNAVLVGDYLFDLEAGRAAGVLTVYVDPSAAFPWREQADLAVTSLSQLLPLLD